jgi:NTP pyrophosphatase (non-canonical NTP hydrolase)
MKNQAKLTLSDYQSLINNLCIELGFEKETVPEKFMLLLEEAGEFARAARKLSGIKVHEGHVQHDISLEAADFFWYLIDICNSLGIDLDKAVREKIEINKSRTWS